MVSRGLRDYLTQVSHVDVRAVSGKCRDPAKVQALPRSPARNTATEATVTTLAADAAGPGETLDRDSATAHRAALVRLMVVEDQPAWAPAMRSRVQLPSSPRRHFVDPSLAVAVLGASPIRLLGDLESMGLLFESMVVRGLRVLAQPLDGQVRAGPLRPHPGVHQALLRRGRQPIVGGAGSLCGLLRGLRWLPQSVD